jgi:hypothetical protein
MEYIHEVLAILERRNTSGDRKDMKYIHDNMIPFLDEWKFLPDSYMDMLHSFGNKPGKKKEV